MSADDVCVNDLYSLLYSIMGYTHYFERNLYNERENKKIKIEGKKESKQANKINRDLTDTSIKYVCAIW